MIVRPNAKVPTGRPDPAHATPRSAAIPMTRRLSTFLLISAIFAISAVQRTQARKLPNVIIIYTDDQGFGDASCLNPNSKFQTPNFDRLAAEGIAFTNGHSSDTVCTPSRYGLLTGRYSWRTTLKAGVFGAERPCLIAGRHMTIPSMLREQGYATAMVGKWHLGMDFPGESYKDRDWTEPVRDMPLDKGFDYFYGIPASLNYGILAWFEGRHATVPPTIFTNKKPNDRHSDYRIMPPYEDSPEETKKIVGAQGMEIAPDFIDNQCLTRFTDKAIQWMRQQTENREPGTGNAATKPFFLYLPYTSPHYPVCPLPEFWGQGDAGGYGEFVIETDHHVGRILAFLEEAGLDENTMILYSSDNGPESSWKQRIEEFGHDSSDIYQGGKRDIYDGGHRVPFFARWPAGIKNPGRKVDALVGQIDILATLAEITGAGIPANAAEDSQSFANLLTNPETEHRRLPLINHASNGRFAITEGAWKLTLPHGTGKKKNAAAAAELYDLSTDPGEETNLIAEHPEIAADLEKKATAIVVTGRTTPGEPQPNDTGHWCDLTWISEDSYDAN